MSNKYKDSSEVPLSTLCDRLKELSTAVTKGRESIDREFTMRIPAEVDRDADCVLSEAAKRIRAMEAERDEAIDANRRQGEVIQRLHGELKEARGALESLTPAINWLLGCAPGEGFANPDNRPGNYWWRSVFREKAGCLNYNSKTERYEIDALAKEGVGDDETHWVETHGTPDGGGQ